MKKKSCLLSLLILLCGCIGGVDGDTALPSHFVAVFRGDSSPDYRIIGDKREASHRFTPCSTFKIISTAMLLDSGAAELDTRLGYDGTEYSMPEWNKDVTLLEAFRYSCVPYYRKAVLLLDKSYIQECLNALNYGNCDIGGTGRVADELFWLESSLAISPEEQIEVLHRIFTLGTVFSAETAEQVKLCMYTGEFELGTLYGKTGTGRNYDTGCLEAWYVGFIDLKDGEGRLYFAVHGADSGRDVLSSELRSWVESRLAEGLWGL